MLYDNQWLNWLEREGRALLQTFMNETIFDLVTEIESWGVDVWGKL